MKCLAPKFKVALTEARKKSNVAVISGALQPSNRKRGRPRKHRLKDSRKRLQQLLLSHDERRIDEILNILSKINSMIEFEAKEVMESKIGNLLKLIFCSPKHDIWHKNEKLLHLANAVAKKLIKSID